MGVAWAALPDVQTRVNRRASGKSEIGWHAHCLSLLAHDLLGRARMLVLRRDSNWLEEDLARRNVFSRCDVLTDPSRVAFRDERIRHIGANLEDAHLPSAMYDAVWCDVTLCHVREQRLLAAQIAQSLQPNGFLFAYEYVGADRFAIGSTLRAKVQAVFSLIPERYRRTNGNHAGVLKEADLPPPEGVPARDKSAPITSSTLTRTLREYFEFIESRPLGGTLLQFVLRDIAANFKSNDRFALAVLEMLFAIEDALIDSGELESDFMLLVGRRQ